jgi:hypothetical protein
LTVLIMLNSCQDPGRFQAPELTSGSPPAAIHLFSVDKLVC